MTLKNTVFGIQQCLYSNQYNRVITINKNKAGQGLDKGKSILYVRKGNAEWAC